MKKVLLSSFVILSACLTQEGMCSNANIEETNENNQTKTSPVKTSSIEERKDLETEIETKEFVSPEKIKRDDLSLIIETVNRVQTFLVTEKENLKNFKKLEKESLQKIAVNSPVILMEEFRNYPLSFIEDIQKRKEIMKNNSTDIIEQIGEPLYKQTLAGLNIIIHILNSFSK